MKTKSTSILIGFILILGVGLLVSATKKPAFISQPVSQGGTSVSTSPASQPAPATSTGTSTTPVKKPVTTVPKTTPPAPTGLTLAVVATHNSRSSCWSAIDGNVYDLTSWIPNHPGGERAILSLCGTDGSEAYNEQHGGSSRTARILAGFKLGALTN
jgi:cytochrome b involved in lipid metabolism